ncbi:sensor domain-containing diguanylate cyclase [Cereibacter changlensis JA139]|uniref:diguanylate cyclase n=2 Tax=Cereibacter changlensis TaxID=402884 RepID=A0A2T4JT29_9RHOB|nr:diguanylate cyclase [Cereibacter changlensis]PTE21036.1 sensor domain-containing diguanylate cyclase [Cereibacter changlensis JA139]PZX48270.1 diguanylate cyclase (GGDEF)-like protein [Cereibacter changlensis]
MSRTIQLLRRQSLRSWMIFAMICAVLPLLLSATIGYSLYHRTIVQPFREVLSLQHDVLVGLEGVQGRYWTIAGALNDYVLTGDEEQRQIFEAARLGVEEEFRNLEANAATSPHLRDQIHAARQIWAQVSRHSAAVMAQPRDGIGAMVPDLERVVATEQEIPAAAHQLESVLMRMRDASEVSHADALRAFRQLELGALAAILLSLGMMGLGGFIVNRAIVLSADELVAGAKRFASGRHDKPVLITVPPELAAVADAFNSMTRTIIAQEAQLAEHARRDSLTSLLNRREFDSALAMHMDRLEKGGAPFALLLGDVDHFKQVNDQHGHVVGDEVLRSVAVKLQAGSRHADTAFRYGGEEFALILTDTSPEAALLTAERLRLAIEDDRMARRETDAPRVTISFGLAFCEAVMDPDVLVRAADQALYEAKARGRNRIVVNTAV